MRRLAVAIVVVSVLGPAVVSAQTPPSAALVVDGAEVCACTADADGRCVLVMPHVTPGWAHVSVQHDGIAEEIVVALRGIETQLEVRVEDGVLVVDRISAFPPTLTLTLIPTHGDGVLEHAPFFWLFNVTPVLIGARGRVQNIFFYELTTVGGATEALLGLRYHWCGNSVRGSAGARAGTGALVFSTPASGSHAPLQPDASYRGQICVEVIEPGAWWGEEADPITLLPPAPAGTRVVSPTDVFCNVDHWTGRELLRRTAEPPLPPRPASVDAP